MKNFILLYAMSCIISYQDAKSCGPEVCFNWKVSDKKLTLICKVQKFFFQAFIKDPFGNVQGDCLPPIKTVDCKARYKNGTIDLNLENNEMTFIVKGDINQKVNGNWTCQHGSRKDVAHVEVTVIVYKGLKIKETRERTIFGQQCVDIIMCISALSFIFAVTVTLVVISFLPWRPFNIDGCLMEYGTLCCKDRKADKQCVTRLKKSTFAVSTILFFGFALMAGFLDTVDCSLRWPFLFIGLITGAIYSVLFLYKDKHSKDTTTICREEVQDNMVNRKEQEERETFV